jgi:hypothetical protein
MSETKERAQGTWGLLLLLMFLFGGAVGYIARDVRADEEVKRAAADARLEVQQATLETFQRLERAGQALVRGVSATAESTRAAVAQPSQPAADQTLTTQARPTPAKKPESR